MALPRLAVLLVCFELRSIGGAGCEGIDTGDRIPSETHGIRDALLCSEEVERLWIDEDHCAL